MLPIAAGLVKLLASSGLTLLSSAVETKGREFIEDKLGVKLPSEDAKLTESQVLELKRLETVHEEFLLTHVREMRELQLKEQELAYKDTADARSMNTRINESAHATALSKNIAAYLALIVILVGFLLLGTTRDADVRTAVVGLMTLVLGFYFGSTSSSKEKDAAIRSLTESAK